VVTPFTRDDEIDEEGLRELINFLKEDGVHGLIVTAGTSEFVSLSAREQKKVISIVKDEAKIPVIAGILYPGIRDAMELIEYSKDVGVDSVMLVTPYYNKPTQNGIYHYYKSITERIDIPVILYNIPERTGVNIEPQTLARLAEIDNVVGIKECNRELGQFLEKVRLTGNNISVLSGNDDIAVQEMFLGASGAIVASANLIPKTWVKIFEMCEKGEFERAYELHREFLPLFKVLFSSEQNPGPLKEALKLAGKPAGHVRVPLTEPREETKKSIKEVMENLGLLKLAI